MHCRAENCTEVPRLVKGKGRRGCAFRWECAHRRRSWVRRTVKPISLNKEKRGATRGVAPASPLTSLRDARQVSPSGSLCSPLWKVNTQGYCEGSPDSSVGKESACHAEDASSIPGLERLAGEGIGHPLQCSWASLLTQLVKNLPATQETWIRSLGWKDPLEKAKATHSSVLAWRIPWTV